MTPLPALMPSSGISRLGDHLEIEMVDVLYRLLRVRRLSFWRILPHPDGARVRLLAGLDEGRALAMSDPGLEPDELSRLDAHAGFAACVSTGESVRVDTDIDGVHCHLFPISDAREPIGILEIEERGPLTDERALLVEGILRLYRHHLAMLDMHEHDSLTGLLNRESFEDVFIRRIARHVFADASGRNIELVGRRRGIQPTEAAWLAAIDIDHFKRVNESYGHLFGDEVLLLVARLMRTVFRPNDALFRFSGAGFVALLGMCEPFSARTALERFRATVDTFSFPQIGHITVSIGYTRIGAEDTPADAFDRAERALFYAKRNGRNQAHAHEDLSAAGHVQEKAVPVSDLELF